MSAQRDSLKATYYRTALLLGLVGGECVHSWAEQAIEQEDTPHPALFELVSVPTSDLTGLRHALWPLVIDPEPPAILKTIFGRLHADLATGRRDLKDTLTIIRQMRSMLRLPPPIYAAVNAILVAYAQNSQQTVIEEWLEQFSGSKIEPMDETRE